MYECFTYPPLKAPTGFFAGKAVAIGSCNRLEVANVRCAKVGRAVAAVRAIAILDAIFVALNCCDDVEKKAAGNATMCDY
jgi:hypothetical protein